MKYLNSRITYSITLYVLIMVLLFTIKPRFIFKDDGSIKPYGVNDSNSGETSEHNKTIYSLGVISISAAIVAFYLFCIIDVVFK